MSNQSCLVSSCRSCRYYTPEGRRGGLCQQLGAPVSSHWKACSLAFPPFAPSWEHLEELVTLTSSTAIRHDLVLSKTSSNSVTEIVSSISSSNSSSSEEKIFA